jgi:hypothetical protein
VSFIYIKKLARKLIFHLKIFILHDMVVLGTISCNSALRIRPLEVESSFGSKGVLNRKNLTYGVKQPRVSLVLY